MCHVVTFEPSCGACSNEDVCKTLYPGGTREEGVWQEVEPGCKVDRVCEAVRRGLMEAGEDTYMLSIITSYVRMSQPQLETVLSVIHRLKGWSSCVCRCGVGMESALLSLLSVSSLFSLSPLSHLFSLPISPPSLSSLFPLSPPSLSLSQRHKRPSLSAQ